MLRVAVLPTTITLSLSPYLGHLPTDCQKDGKTYLNGDKLVDPETPCTVCYCQGKVLESFSDPKWKGKTTTATTSSNHRGQENCIWTTKFYFYCQCWCCFENHCCCCYWSSILELMQFVLRKYFILLTFTLSPCFLSLDIGGEILCSSVTCFHRDDCTPKYIPGVCCPEYDNCPGKLIFCLFIYFEKVVLWVSGCGEGTFLLKVNKEKKS